MENEKKMSAAEMKEEAEKRQLHQTKFLLKQYRRVVYSVRMSESELNQRMEYEYGTKLTTLELNADLAGIDLTNTKLEKHAQYVIRSKRMLEIIDRALLTVKEDPDEGELMYHVLYLTYFSPTKPRNRDEIIMEMERIGYRMCLATYHIKLNQAIKAIDRILWGYTARDCAAILALFEGDDLDQL